MGDYPSDIVLKYMEEKNIWVEGARELIDTLINEWHWNEYVKFQKATPEEVEEYNLREDTYVLKMSTGGWSGNEDIMSAIECNKYFNNLFWESSRRGGHYVYLIPAKYYDDNYILDPEARSKSIDCPPYHDPKAICNKGLACDGCPEFYKER